MRSRTVNLSIRLCFLQMPSNRPGTVPKLEYLEATLRVLMSGESRGNLLRDIKKSRAWYKMDEQTEATYNEQWRSRLLRRLERGGRPRDPANASRFLHHLRHQFQFTQEDWKRVRDLPWLDQNAIKSMPPQSFPAGRKRRAELTRKEEQELAKRESEYIARQDASRSERRCQTQPDSSRRDKWLKMHRPELRGQVNTPRSSEGAVKAATSVDVSNKPHQSTAPVQVESKRPHQSAAPVRVVLKQSHQSTAPVRVVLKQPHQSTALVRVESKQPHQPTASVQVESKQPHQSTASVRVESKQSHQPTASVQVESKQPLTSGQNDSAPVQVESNHTLSLVAPQEPDVSVVNSVQLAAHETTISTMSAQLDPQLQGTFQRWAQSSKSSVAGNDHVDAFTLCRMLNETFKIYFQKFEGFSLDLVRSLVMMVTKADAGGKVGFEQFSQLWARLSLLKSVFTEFDFTNNGTASLAELREMLQMLGYRVGDEVLQILLTRYGSENETLHFQDFVACCLRLRVLVNHHSEMKAKSSENVRPLDSVLREFLVL